MIDHRHLRHRLADDEDGWALVTALLVMVVMVIGGMSLLTTVDTQTRSSKVERQRETAFNLAEGALNAQMFALSRNWSGKGMAAGGAAAIAANPYPAFCTPSSTSTNCPSNSALLSAYPNVDASGATWNTTVRDDGASPLDTFYDDTAIANQPGYDANNNGKLWVRAQATAKGKTRTLSRSSRLRSSPRTSSTPRSPQDGSISRTTATSPSSTAEARSSSAASRRRTIPAERASGSSSARAASRPRRSSWTSCGRRSPAPRRAQTPAWVRRCRPRPPRA